MSRRARLRGNLPPELQAVIARTNELAEMRREWREQGKRYWGTRVARPLDLPSDFSESPPEVDKSSDSEFSDAPAGAVIGSQGGHGVTSVASTESEQEITEVSEFEEDRFIQLSPTDTGSSDGPVGDYDYEEDDFFQLNQWND